MKNKELIKVLRTLSPEEMRAFGRYLKGTAKRMSQDRIVFFGYLEKYYPKFPDKKTNRASIAHNLFSKTADPIRKVSDLESNIGVLLKHFLVQQELERQEEQYDFLLLEAYKRRKLDDFFFKKIKKIEKEWEREKPPGIKQLHHEYLLKKIAFTHPNYVQTDKSLITYEVLIQQLDKYYFAEKLFWTSCLKISEDFVNISGANFIKKQYLIREILENNKSLQDSQIEFLAELLDVLVNEHFQNYPHLEEQFIENVLSFDESERNDLIDLLNHISLRDRTVDKREAHRRAFELNKQAIEKRWIFREENLSGFRFLNIVSTACSFGDLDWARYFIDTFGITLSEDEGEAFMSIAHAIVDFQDRLYEQVIDRLLHTKFRSPLHEVYDRTLRLRCYYELEFSKLFNPFAQAFKDFLRRSLRSRKLAKNFVEEIQNFIRFACELENIRHIKYRPNVAPILERIKSCNNVTAKRWLIEKAEELM